VLLQIAIAKEDTKSGFEPSEFETVIKTTSWESYSHVKILGLMGMGTFTDDTAITLKEFKTLKSLFDAVKPLVAQLTNFDFKELSMGMSGDWDLAVQEGSTMVRVGSAIFGER
jgi:PLP dependent protein